MLQLLYAALCTLYEKLLPNKFISMDLRRTANGIHSSSPNATHCAICTTAHSPVVCFFSRVLKQNRKNWNIKERIVLFGKSFSCYLKLHLVDAQKYTAKLPTSETLEKKQINRKNVDSSLQVRFNW